MKKEQVKGCGSVNRPTPGSQRPAEPVASGFLRGVKIQKIRGRFEGLGVKLWVVDAGFSQRRAIPYGVKIGVAAISCCEQGIDTGHLHKHLIVNSVSCVDGKKLHQNTADLQHHRDVNDQICMKYHLSVLPKPQKHSRKKRMEPGEYQAGLRGDSWKLELVFVLNQALREAEEMAYKPSQAEM